MVDKVTMPNVHLNKNDPLKGKKSGKWSKYGGSNYGVVKEEITEPWTCQACGEINPVAMKPFLYEYVNGEFLRLCNRCYHLTKKRITFTQIITIVRKSH